MNYEYKKITPQKIIMHRLAEKIDKKSTKNI